jgi:hypothetical protein
LGWSFTFDAGPRHAFPGQAKSSAAAGKLDRKKGAKSADDE